MPKNKITQYSQTPNQNTDIGGISLLETASPRVIKDYMPELMSQLADMNAGASPLDDTFTIQNSEDKTKQFRDNGEKIPTGTTRVEDVEARYQLVERGGIPLKVTIYSTAGSHEHTFEEATRYFRVYGLGGGGGGGAVDGQGDGTGAAASGGNSGNWGWTDYLPKESIADADIVVGARGTGGAAGVNDGSDGSNTTWNDGTNVYLWRGGKGGKGILASPLYPYQPPDVNGSNTGTIYGTYRQGSEGITNGNTAMACPGGWTEYGTGITGARAFATTADGQDGVGNGSGGGGAAVSNVGGNAAGGNGRPGMIIVEEY